MTKALCTVAVGSHLDLLPYALPTFEVFADRHGYELVAPREVAAGLHPCWEKLRLVRELLDDHEQVLWVDADAVIADPSRDVFEDMDTDRSWGWVMHVSGNTLLPNAGVLALRAEPPALEILDRAWARRDRYANHPWLEQAAIYDQLGFVEVAATNSVRLGLPTPLMTAVQFLGTEWNSLAIDQAPAPRIKHYAGVPHELRLEAMAWDAAALAKRDRAPAYDLSIVLPLAGASEQEALRCLASIAELGDARSFQTVIVVPHETPLDPLLATLEGDVTIVRSHGGPDHALLGGLSAADGAVSIVATGPVVLGAHALESTSSLLDASASAVVLHKGGQDVLAVRRRALPPTGWLANAGAGSHPLGPAVHALRAAGVQVVDVAS
jgi:hypothetical protein